MWLQTLLVNFYDLLSFIIATILPRRISQLILPKVDHFAYHLSLTNRFEGYYTRIQTEDGSSIVIIMSSVHNAKAWGSKSHFAHFSVTPSQRSQLRSIRVDLHPDRIVYTPLGPQDSDGRQAFKLQADDFLVFSVEHDNQYYWLSIPDPDNEQHSLIFSAKIVQRTPLRPSDLLYTPHDSVVRLGSLIPVHWHIFSTCSAASYAITTRSNRIEPDGKKRTEETTLAEGEGLAHMEKNWGRGFPDSWTWMQGFSQNSSEFGLNPTQVDQTASLTLAGGTSGIAGINSYLVAYRSPALNLRWDFAVPWTILFWIPGLRNCGPFCQETVSKDDASVIIDVSTFTRRLVVTAKSAEKETDWLPLDCPLISGHGNITARETFRADIDVMVYVKPLWLSWNPWAWALVERRTFREAGFELGGGFRTDGMLKEDNDLEMKKTQ